jgi:hypothetical protein
MVLSKAVFEVVFHPTVFVGLLYAAHVAVFPVIERRWGARRIAWRQVLLGDIAGFLFLSFVVYTAASYVNRLIGLRVAMVDRQCAADLLHRDQLVDAPQRALAPARGRLGVRHAAHPPHPPQ